MFAHARSVAFLGLVLVVAASAVQSFSRNAFAGNKMLGPDAGLDTASAFVKMTTARPMEMKKAPAPGGGGQAAALPSAPSLAEDTKEAPKRAAALVEENLQENATEAPKKAAALVEENLQENATEAPKQAAALVEENLQVQSCPSWCAGNTRPWSIKCNWAGCNGCSQCQAPTPAPTAEPYILGVTGENSCPDGYHKIESLDECEVAATYLGLACGEEVSSNVLPGGCYKNLGSNANFNSAEGNGRTNKSPICKQASATLLEEANMEDAGLVEWEQQQGLLEEGTDKGDREPSGGNGSDKQ